jgi:hypothetical protein
MQAYLPLLQATFHDSMRASCHVSKNFRSKLRCGRGPFDRSDPYYLCSVSRIPFTLMRIRILSFTIIRIRIQRLFVTLKRITIMILPFTLIADSDPDPTFHFDAAPDPDPILQIIKAQNLENCSNRLIFQIFWLVICKLKRIRIQRITMMRIRIQLITCDADPDADPDPTFQFDADPVSDPQHCLRSIFCITWSITTCLCDIKMFLKSEIAYIRARKWCS